MKRDVIANVLLKILIIQLIIFSISNMIIVMMDTYGTLAGKNKLYEMKFFNPKILLLSIVIWIVIIFLYTYFFNIKKTLLFIKKMDTKIFLIIGIPFLLSSITLFLGEIYKNAVYPISLNMMQNKNYVIVLLIVFMVFTAALLYTLIIIIKNRALIISKIGLKLIFVIGIAFTASIILLNSMSKFMESFLLDHGDINPKTFVRIYNTISLGFIVIAIVTFILIILTAINKKVEYLNYINSKVRRISEIQYLDNLDIKGNDELSDLANSINIMSRRLKDNYEREKKIEEEKNEIIVSVSHDLKTPLTSIIGYLELLKHQKFKRDDEKIEYIDIAYGKAINLKNLIDELFEYTKVVNDYIPLEKVRFNIAILINQILGEETLFFKEMNINIEFESESKEIYCEIDVEKMVRVICNIIKNAQKYSFPDTTFKVRISTLKEYALITFENIGEHIEKEELNLIFEKMYRVDKSRSSEKEGSGLGLAIAKKIVELHDGQLWAECEGNTIKFNILLKRT